MANTYKVRSVGGALIVTLPQSILRIIPLKAGDMVSFTVANLATGGVIVVRPERPAKPKKATK